MFDFVGTCTGFYINKLTLDIRFNKLVFVRKVDAIQRSVFLLGFDLLCPRSLFGHTYFKTIVYLKLKNQKQNQKEEWLKRIYGCSDFLTDFVILTPLDMKLSNGGRISPQMRSFPLDKLGVRMIACMTV